MSLKPIICDSTKIRSWMQCDRKYFYSYLEHLESSRSTSIDLEFGKVVHECLEFFENQMLEGESKDQALEAALNHSHILSAGWEVDLAFQEESRKTRVSAMRLLIWYAEQYHENGLEAPIRPVANEIPFRENLNLLLEASDFYSSLTEYPIYPNFLIAGRFDSIIEGPSKGEYWLRERKTSSQSLGNFYFARYSPDIQVSLYTWVAKLLFPHLNLQGVLLEAFQIGTNFIRMQRKQIQRWPEQSFETARSIIRAANQMYLAGVLDDQPQRQNFPLNEGCCMAGGMPCPFRELCNTHPMLLDEAIGSHYRTKKPWNPLDEMDESQIASLSNTPTLYL